MKVAIIEDNSASNIGIRHSDVLVEDELQCWISIQVALHLNAAINGRVDDIP